MGLDGGQIGSLVKLIVGVYTSESSLNLVLRDTYGRQLDFFVAPGNLPERTANLVMHRDIAGDLPKFISGLKNNCGDKFFHEALEKVVGVSDLVTLKQHCQCLTLNVRLAFVDRHNFRQDLTELVGAEAGGYRVFSLNGPYGRRYCREFLSQIVKRGGKRVVTVPLTSDLTIDKICTEITSRLDLELKQADIPIEMATPERVGKSLAIWLNNKTRNGNKFIWLVLDLTNRKGDMQMVDAIVNGILGEISINPFENIFVVLVGDDARRITQLEEYALHSELNPFAELDYKTYLTNLAAEKKRKIPDDQLDMYVRTITGGKNPPYSREDVSAFSKRLHELIKSIQ